MLGNNKSILFCDNTLWGLVNFRGDIIRYFVTMGFKVILVAPQDKDTFMTTKIPSGVRYIGIHMERCSQNVLKDVAYFVQLLKIYHQERPNYIVHYTIKPNIYGAIAARILGIPCTDVITGLGHALSESGGRAWLASRLYGFGLGFAHRVFVLNEAIRDFVLSKDFCSERNLILLSGGEGVNLDKFPFESNESDQVVFLMVARLLADKGYREFVEATRLLKAEGFYFRSQIVGPMDDMYPEHISEAEVKRDENDGLIEYLGATSRIQTVLGRKGVVVVLPSYHEGLNRSLMEACAMGKPIITTDIPGCREAVDECQNGFLVPPKNAQKLAEAMKRYLLLSDKQKNDFSIYSRKKAEYLFDIRRVIDAYQEVLRDAGILTI